MGTSDSGHSPIEDFSQCHAGILGHLQTLGTLPALLEPAARARQIAADTLSFFREAVFEHHAEEEKELFPAVLASAHKGVEHDKVQAIVAELTAEHRQVEAAWAKLEPRLKAVAKGHDVDMDGADISCAGADVSSARALRGRGLPAAVAGHPGAQQQPPGGAGPVDAPAPCAAARCWSASPGGSEAASGVVTSRVLSPTRRIG